MCHDKKKQVYDSKPKRWKAHTVGYYLTDGTKVRNKAEKKNYLVSLEVLSFLPHFPILFSKKNV